MAWWRPQMPRGGEAGLPPLRLDIDDIRDLRNFITLQTQADVFVYAGSQNVEPEQLAHASAYQLDHVSIQTRAEDDSKHVRSVSGVCIGAGSNR